MKEKEDNIPAIYDIRVKNAYQMQEIEDIIQKAVDFHGHLGPFLVVDVCMGLIGLRELETTSDNSQLHVTISVRQTVPL